MIFILTKETHFAQVFSNFDSFDWEKAKKPSRNSTTKLKRGNLNSMIFVNGLAVRFMSLI